jgi:hypothetical protein
MSYLMEFIKFLHDNIIKIRRIIIIFNFILDKFLNISKYSNKLVFDDIL